MANNNDIIIALESSETFRTIFKSLSEGILIVNSRGIIVQANPVAEEMFGFQVAELEGTELEKLLPERFRSHHVDLRAQYYKHPTPRRMGIGRDLLACRKDGSEFPVEISLSYFTEKENTFILAFISDISQRKMAEDALKQSEEQLIVYAAQLEKKVHERTQELNKTVINLEKEINERLKAETEVRKSLQKERELNELKSKFISIASHEFRTPLSTILSSTSLIQQYNDKGSYDKIDKHCSRIRSSIQNLTAILNDFLSLGKLEEGKISIVIEEVNIKELCEEIQEEIRGLFKDGQQLIIYFDNAIQKITSDPRIIKNILYNLLSNASKYSESNKKIQLHCSNVKDNFVFTIKDEGYGIPESEQKNLFARFFRASNVTNIQGTGLGLSIVQRYAELIGGSITFTSEMGRGSSFHLSLPLESNPNKE